jgi:aerobic carbon-monoxide dehydrogenase large subunit
MAVTEETVTYVGRSVPRKEDAELLTGQGRYVDDLTLPGMLWFSLVRSPFAHARIRAIDVSRARKADGVVGVFTGEDLAEDFAAPLPCAWPVTPEMKNPPHWPLARDSARYAGDAVAVVVADTRAHAKDAAELVDVDWEQLPAVVDVEAALADGTPLVHPDLGTNSCYVWEITGGDVDAVFAAADVVVTERYRQQRLIPAAIEPRGVLVQPVPANGEYTLWSATQIPHVLRTTLALTLGIPESKLRIIAPEVGGGFGSKLDVYAEEALALALAKRLGRPLKWVEERSEAHVATIHGRDVIQEIDLAADSEGKISGVRVRLKSAMGAYLQLVTPGIPILGAWLYGGCYDVKAYGFHCEGVFTNTTPIDAYRGAGRPEATYAIERAIDALARKVGKDVVEIRRLNFIKEFPAELASGLTVDAGDFDACLDRALELADYAELRRVQRERADGNARHRLGIGLATYIEMCGLAPSRVLGSLAYVAGGWDATTIRCLPTGVVQAVIGTSPHGQGHVTTFSQIVADQLGVPIESVEVLHGDTASSPLGMDTYGSRSLVIGGVALHNAAQKVIAKSRTIAAHALEVSEADLRYENGRFTVAGTDKSMTVAETAFAAWTAHALPDGMEPGLEETAVYDPINFSWPAGCHLAVVDVDALTGDTRVVRYVAVDDLGTVVNPQIVEGQVHGGVAQGVAQALYEEAIYDDQGNLLTNSFASYLVPAASDLPTIEVDRTETPSPSNPLGAKGVGETGAIAAPAAVMNAVVDALAPFGITDVDMPASPERVWRAIEEVRR